MKTKSFNNFTNIDELSKELERFIIANNIITVVSFTITSANDTIYGFARFFAILIYIQK